MSVIKKSNNSLDIDVRFLLANERTLLAWIRTGLTFIAGGVAVTLLTSNESLLTHVSGVGAILLGAIFALIGYARYRTAYAAIMSGKLPKTGFSAPLVVICVILFALILIISSL